MCPGAPPTAQPIHRGMPLSPEQHHLCQRSQGVRAAPSRVQGLAGPVPVAGLLRDLALLTMNRAWEGGTFTRAAGTLLDVMSHLTRTYLDKEEYDPYDGEERPYRPLDPEVGAKGLGHAGAVPSPDDMWRKHAPVTLECALQSLPDQSQSTDPGLLAMATRMAHDGPLGQCGTPKSSHFRAFAKNKNAVKGALIADLRQLNQVLPKTALLRAAGFSPIYLPSFETKPVFHKTRYLKHVLGLQAPPRLV